ncbi:MAG: leucyl/phenylalanyl-tRNA--protein transferase [Planctomycetes bacterium]|nr:leucyl/phenylalanyl-tRNA--protein transferase [Planctomycetota bacterium]
MAFNSMGKTTVFPPISQADDSGLLLIGGDLTSETLLDAYRNGIFPWPAVDRGSETLAWWSPDPRAIIELNELYVSRRLGRRIRSGQFEIRVNRDFAGVIASCAQRTSSDGVWITPAIQSAYQQLHELGYAHSVETWHDGHLVGGVYGVAIGGYFAGESMFYRMRDASKVALVFLVQRLRELGFQLFDIQQWTPHTARLGAKLILRDEFIERLENAVNLPVTFA